MATPPTYLTESVLVTSIGLDLFPDEGDGFTLNSQLSSKQVTNLFTDAVMITLIRTPMGGPQSARYLSVQLLNAGHVKGRKM